MSDRLRIVVNCSSEQPTFSAGAAHLLETQPILAEMTNIFRMGFNEVFDQVWTFQIPNAQLVEHQLLCRRLTILASPAKRMDRMEADDYIVVLELDGPDDALSFQSAVAKYANLPSMDRARIVLEQLAATGYSDIIKPFLGRGRGSSLWAHGSSGDDLLKSLLLGFYHYAWVILLRLEREQSTLRLSDDLAEIGQSTNYILHHRIRLVNLERYFMTHDRSSRPEYKSICDELAAKYNLNARFQRLTSIHQAFESYVQDMTRILEAKSSRATTRALKFIAGCSIPISLFGALLKADTSAEIFSNTINVILNAKLYVLILLSAVPVLGTVLIALAIDRIRERLRKRRNNRARS